MTSLSRILVIAVDAGDPDLITAWANEGHLPTFRALREGSAWGASPRTRLIEGVFPGRRTGDHKAEAMFFARGPSIVPGRIARPVSNMQFSPTVGALLGVPLPADGKPIPEVAGAAVDETSCPAGSSGPGRGAERPGDGC